MAVDADRLIQLEEQFSPTVGAAPSLFSKHERVRTDRQNAGGDKMGPTRNGYAQAYASLLAGFEPDTVVELGVFQGVSMALWCDLFPSSTVIGLDLEFSRFEANRPLLVQRGAFTANSPLLIPFDAYQTDPPLVQGPVGLFVDDGPHTEEAIVNVLRLVGPLMAEGGVYVIEDFSSGGDLLAEAFPDAHIVYAGRLNAARL
jgi:hypothetical protein